MKINLSVIILVINIVILLLIFLFPHSINHFFFSHFIFRRILAYILISLPICILLVSLYEILKKGKTIQPWVSLVISIGLCVLMSWVLMNIYKKPLFYEPIGHISFEAKRENAHHEYYCKCDFDVQIGIESKSNELKNEINLKRNDILQIIKKAAIENCEVENLEKYINENYIDSINCKLATGKIREIAFKSLSDSTHINMY